MESKNKEFVFVVSYGSIGYTESVPCRDLEKALIVAEKYAKSVNKELLDYAGDFSVSLEDDELMDCDFKKHQRACDDDFTECRHTASTNDGSYSFCISVERKLLR